ncbi:hypothetical protein ACFY4B_11835 [Kitasatospora sp. NPDC001261]|uniref:hypothetical protein n=1 Tax=Kitasatospora sp. NPDC001261 TaxID=3364012 RepID=UPI0036B6B13E
MVDVAHVIPRSPDDPPPPPPWWRRPRVMRPLAGGLAVAAVVGGGLWAWQPWRSLEIAQSACWSALSRDDLKPLAGRYGKVYETVPRARIQTPTAPDEPGIRSTDCRVVWNPDDGSGGFLLEAQVAPAWDGVDADRARDTGQHHAVVDLDFGPGAVGLAGGDPDHPVRLYVRCDFQVPTADKPDRKAPPYIRVEVGGEPVDGVSPAKARQAYADAALKIARVAAAEYQCTNQVQLPSAAPAVPALPKEKADG